MDAVASPNRLDSLPLWRLLGMLDDAERIADTSTARLLVRVIRERLRAMRQQESTAHAS